MTLPRFLHNPLCDLLILALLLAVFFGLSLGQRPYSAPSESRYVEIGREMAASGDYVTPRLDYVKYFEKPPLFYWIQAGFTKRFGTGFFISRIPTALFAIALCLITYGLGHMLYGRLAGWFSTIILATSLYMFALSRIVLLDVPVSVFITGTLTAFLYVVNAPPSAKRTVILYIMYIAAACAVLTKGLIGAVLPGIIIFLWIALTRRWSIMKDIRLVSGTALFLLIAVPWHILVSLRNPEFPHFYFIHEHLERYLTRVHGRYQPFWFFGLVLVAGLFPWISFTWQALKSGLSGFWQDRYSNGNALFLVLWIGFIFVFFSLSDSKLIPYILPIFPPIAALLGRYFVSAWQNKSTPRFKTGFLFILLLFTAMAIVPSLLAQILDPDNKVITALNQAGDDAQTLSIGAMCAAGILLLVYIQGNIRHVILTLFIVAAVIIQLGDNVASHYNKDSMEGFSAYINNLIVSFHEPNAEIANYEDYYQDAPIYLKRRITIVNWKGELEFGSANENTSAWIINDKTFWERWLKPNHFMFVVMRTDTYQRLQKNNPKMAAHLHPLRQDNRNILFANRQI